MLNSEYNILGEKINVFTISILLKTTSTSDQNLISVFLIPRDGTPDDGSKWPSSSHLFLLTHSNPSNSYVSHSAWDSSDS